MALIRFIALGSQIAAGIAVYGLLLQVLGVAVLARGG